MSQPVDPFAEILSAKKALQDGLTLLDRSASGDADQDDAGRLAAWEQVAAGFATSESPEQLRERVPTDRLKEFDDELSEVIRLNAVLVAAVASEQERLLGRLRAVRESRRDLAYYGSVEPEGERCDISG